MSFDTTQAIVAPDNSFVQVRHDLDPSRKEMAIEKRVRDLRSQCTLSMLSADASCQAYKEALEAGNPTSWTKAPSTSEEVSAIFDEIIQHELTFYSTARVLEVRDEVVKYFLVYGPEGKLLAELNKTGPFSTLDAAFSWFYRGGR